MPYGAPPEVYPATKYGRPSIMIQSLSGSADGVAAAPEAIQAREDSRRACLRIRCRRGCIPEGYAPRGGPARVFGVRRLRLDVRFGSHNCRKAGVLSFVYRA